MKIGPGSHGTVAKVLRLAGAACALIVFPACDQSFDPIAESDRVFSVFGHLDPAQDTQWIRVMPTRETIFTSRDPLGIAVALEELGHGRPLDVRDSLAAYPYPYDEATGADAAYVHNFWTTDPIVPGETYRFTATGPNGISATATLSIPPEYSVTVAIRRDSVSSGGWPVDEVRIEGVDHLAFVRTRTLIRHRCDRGVQEVRWDIPEGSTDPHTVAVTKVFRFAVPPPCNPQIPEQRDLWIVATGSPWPRAHVTSRPWHAPSAAFGVPELPTNLENGIGFLGGVHIETIPYEDCEIVGTAPIPEFCILRYDDAKARLTGTVFDACGNRPLVDASVRLEEIDADPAGHRRIRTSPTGLFGGYRIASLDAGVRYAMTVLHPHPLHMPPPEDEEFPIYVEHADTLEFGLGEQRTLNVTLQREGSC